MTTINRAAEVKAYKYLRSLGMTHAGAIGAIDNLEAESDGFYANRMEYLLVRRLKEAGYNYTDESYTAAIDNGSITLEEYMHPLPGKQYGHGLAQWTSPGRKKRLYELAKQKGVSISDLEMQLEYLIWELKNVYKNVWNVLTTSKSIREASDYFLVHFEAPANTGEVVRQGRANRGYLFEKYLKCQEQKGDSMGITAKQILDVMRSWLGMSRSKGTHKPIIDLYNSYKPLARGYRASYTDDYCDITVSAAFIKLNAVNLIGGTECGVEEHIKIFDRKGIWKEDGKITPRPGDIICYNWDDSTQPNDGWADHIGIVEVVDTKNRTITAIEGNTNGGVVGRRTIPIGWGFIRGYACPKYADASGKTETDKNENKDYLSKGDTGSAVKTMQAMLIAVGYPCGSSGADGDFGTSTEKALKNYQKDHKLEPDGCYGTKTKASLETLYKKSQVAISQPATATAVEAAQCFDKVKAGAYKTTTELWMKYGAGKEKNGILVVPKGRKVQCYGYYSKAVDGTSWLYVVYNGKVGFCSSKYLKKC